MPHSVGESSAKSGSFGAFMLALNRTVTGFLSDLAAWLIGAGLITFGLLWIHHDAAFRTFDLACAAVGVMILPPVARTLRALIGCGPRTSALLGAVALFAALDADMSRGADAAGRAPAPLAQAAPDGWAMHAASYSPGAAPLPSAPATDENALRAMRASRLEDRLALVQALNQGLQPYGLSARLVAGGDALEFAGPGLDDPSKQALLIATTQDAREQVGLDDVRFAAPQRPALPQSAAAEATFPVAANAMGAFR